ncbi:MAG: MFS transporter [Actinomycetota bacterium]|nr:MFS transporter [Actinomycetota bacterium]
MKQPLQEWFRKSVWRHRDLRIVGPARALSVLGDELALIALLLRVHDAGAGPAGITLLLTSAAVPAVLLAPWAGRLADRYDSRRLATLAALGQLCVCLALAFSTSPWVVYPLVIALQAGQAVANPTWGALIPRIVGEGDIARAQGGLTALLTAGAVAGPALGGLLTGLGGARLPLLADAASFGVLAMAGLAVRTRRGGPWSSPDGVDALPPKAFDGVRLLTRDAVLRPVFVALMGYIVVGEATNVVEVFLVRDVLRGTAAQYGLVGMAASAGIVAGSMLGGRKADLVGRLRRVVLSAAGQAVMILSAGLAPSVLVLAVAWALLGIGNGILNTSSSTLLMTRTPENSRGQAIAAAMGASRAFSVAALVLGGLAGSTLGPRTTFITAGASALAVSAVLGWKLRWAWKACSE